MSIYPDFSPFVIMKIFLKEAFCPKLYFLILSGLVVAIALPLDSLLLRGVSAGPCFCLQARRRKHARRHARPRDGLKAGPALTTI